MSLLIKGVQVVDGTGKDPYKGDVLIQGGLVSSIGEIRGRKADQVMEGLGHYLTPGFIDIHARSDSSLSLFDNPEQEGFVRQGVLNIIGGQHGFSLAPLVYGNVESVRRWSDGSGFNINWRSVKEFLGGLKRFNLGINFGTFAGYCGVRFDVTSGRKGLEKKEADVIHKVLKDAIKEGAFGISFDLERCGSKELKEVAALTAQSGGVVLVKLDTPSGEYVKAIKEIINISKLTRAKIVVEGLEPLKGSMKEFREALDLVKDALEKKIDVRLVLQPHTVTEVHIREYLPKALRSLENKEALKKLKEAKYKLAAKRNWQDMDFRNVWVVSAPKHHFLAGKSVVDIANNWGVDYIEAMFHLIEISELHAVIARDNLSQSLLRGAIAEDAVFVTANLDGTRMGGGVVVNEMARDAFPHYFRTVIGEGLMSIEDAVAKVTSVPAKYFKIPGRGLIEEGTPADLVLLGKEDYEIKEVILRGRVFGEKRLEGEILKRSKY